MNSLSLFALKKMRGILPLIFLFILAFSVNAIVYPNYENIGGNTNDFVLGTSWFNTGLLSYDISSRFLTNGKFLPLVSDINNDGIYEIIALDGYSVKLFKERTLEIVDTYEMQNGNYKQLYIYDINNDSFKEIITEDLSNGVIRILQYNTTSFYELKNISTGYNTAFDGDNAIACNEIESCISLVSFGNIKEPTNQEMIGVFYFNSSNLIQNKALINFTYFNNYYGTSCLSNIPIIDVSDINYDGKKEFTFSYFYVWHNSGGVIIASLSSNITRLTTESAIGVSAEYFGVNQLSPVYCTTNDIIYKFTSPLVYEFDESPSNNKEIVIGIMENSYPNNFRMKSYHYSGSFIDNYPEIQRADGKILSNIIRGNYIADDDNAFCVLGYNDVANYLDLLCGSMITGGLVDNYEYTFKPSNYYNLSSNLTPYFRVIHNIDSSREITGGSALLADYDAPEVLSPFGIISINHKVGLLSEFLYGNCALGNCGANLSWLNPKQNIAMISVDAENFGREDLIGITPTNIWYFDDKYINTLPYFSEYTINPCVESTWKVNTSASISITPLDLDSNNVRARAYLYFNTPYEQDSGWSSYGASGSSFTFRFTANQTIPSGIIRLMISDTWNNETNQTKDIAFSVGSSGVVFGECLTSFINTTPITPMIPIGEITDTTGASYRNSSINEGLNAIDITFGLNLGIKAIWFIIMIALAMVIFVKGHDFTNNGVLLGGTIGIVEFFMILLGFFLGIIGWGIIITIILTGCIVVAVLIRRQFTGGG